MGSKRRSRNKRKAESEPQEDWEKELNIQYHDVNPQWNYTIFPRSDSKQVKKDEKGESKK